MEGWEVEAGTVQDFYPCEKRKEKKRTQSRNFDC